MTIKLTAAKVKKFWRGMCDHYGSAVCNKGNAKEMQLVGGFLGALGILNKEDFLKHYATTLGSRIYVPFKVGSIDPNHSLISQAVVCVHEHVHVCQDADSEASFGLRYLVDKDYRALCEAKAYRTNMEMWWYLTGECPTAATLAATLKHYGCDARDIKAAEAYLAKAEKMVRKGAIASPVTKTAIDILEHL